MFVSSQPQTALLLRSSIRSVRHAQRYPLPSESSQYARCLHSSRSDITLSKASNRSNTTELISSRTQRLKSYAGRSLSSYDPFSLLHTDWLGHRVRTRGLHSSAVARHSGIDRPLPGTGLKVHFKDSSGHLIKTVEANEGDDILSIAHEYDVDLEGACEGSVACSTCHIILPVEHYDLLPEPEDDENDMLDMAFGLTDTSRLGCQVKLTKELDGITCTLPSATRNMFVDGKKSSH